MQNIKTLDYLFLRYRGCFIKLDDICNEFYPHLGKEKMLEKARQQGFPFTCFRIDDSQKGPLFVDINELATVFDDLYKTSYKAFHESIKKVTHSIN